MFSVIRPHIQNKLEAYGHSVMSSSPFAFSSSSEITGYRTVNNSTIIDLTVHLSIHKNVSYSRLGKHNKARSKITI